MTSAGFSFAHWQGGEALPVSAHWQRATRATGAGRSRRRHPPPRTGLRPVCAHKREAMDKSSRRRAICVPQGTGIARWRGELHAKSLSDFQERLSFLFIRGKELQLHI